jgi:hypothetical protein
MFRRQRSPVVKRVFLTCILCLGLAGLCLTLIPVTSRLAEPFLCQGIVERETRLPGLNFRCVASSNGQITPVATAQVVLAAVPLLAALLFLPVYTALVAADRRARSARRSMTADLAVAVRARAEILRVARKGSLRYRALFNTVELQLVLWVHPPEGRPYEARVTWMVEDESLTRLIVGAVLPVRINPRRPEYVYPDQAWAHYAWWS